jgi:hypothetical protein
MTNSEKANDNSVIVLLNIREYLTFFNCKNPPFDVVIQKPNGSFSHFGTGPLWQSWLAKKLNFT